MRADSREGLRDRVESSPADLDFQRPVLELSYRRVIKLSAAFKCFGVERLSGSAVETSFVCGAAFGLRTAEVAMIASDEPGDEPDFAAEYFVVDI